MIKVKINNSSQVELVDSDDLIGIINQSAYILNKPKSDCELEIVITSPRSIQSLNRKYRHINLPTDILSFPLKQFAQVDNILGSIVICPQILDKNGYKMDDAVKHGLLHLLGYDHDQNLKQWDSQAKLIGCRM